MGNSSTIQSSLRVKCFPNGKRLPDGSSKIGSDTSPSDLRENQAIVPNTSEDRQMVFKSSEDSALFANSGGGDAKGTINRKSSHKASLAAARLGSGGDSIKSPGQRNSSNTLPRNPSDASASTAKTASPLTQFPKCFAAEVHPSDRDREQSDSTRTGRLMVHPYTRPKTLTIRAYSANDTNPKPSSFDYASIAESHASEISKLSPMAQTLGDPPTGNAMGTLRYLRSIPDGTSVLHSRCASGNPSKALSRRRLLSKFTSPSLDSATSTTMSCTLLHHPSPTKAFPFFPDGTAYLLSDEQHRAVEQSLCSTKLLLHRLKRLLIENTGHLHSFAEQVGNCPSVLSPVYGNCTSSTSGVDAFEVESPSSKTNSNPLATFAASKEPTNLDDAISEIRLLKEENSRLQEELVKRERYIHLFLQKQSGDNNLTL